MANETMVTISLEEYMDLRKRAEENLYLATRLGAVDQRLWDYENRLRDIERKMDEWQMKSG